MPITHSKVSAKSDGGDSSLVLPSDWNADHVTGEYADKYNPDDETPATTPAIAAEFNGALDSGWAWSTAPTTQEYTQQPGFMRLKHGDATGGVLARAWSPGSSATLAAKLSMNVGNTSTVTRAYIFGVSDQDSAAPTTFNGIYILGYSNNFNITTITRTGGSWTVGTEFTLRTGGMSSGFFYVRHTYASGTGTLYWSFDGVSWAQFPNTASQSLTISHALLLADAQDPFESAWDWVRGWNSVIEKVGK